MLLTLYFVSVEREWKRENKKGCWIVAVPTVICQYAFPTVQAIKEGATGGWRKMERESHKTVRHQPHPFLAKGDFY